MQYSKYDFTLPKSTLTLNLTIIHLFKRYFNSGKSSFVYYGGKYFLIPPVRFLRKNEWAK